ncbi:hypothetical protein XBI1_1450010 [Xenorhabdus bovienii str. Intermedium]|uniref:Uncharacterized protein n=1 Tax=Xenorhabdus bovienii str. Intermedium TaxID=1379677 RepID=A0A077QD94_XENBV|nr:hypothetical protein XBI1_1450010 [Xenorhabdus bovienii str. Intermedium]
MGNLGRNENLISTRIAQELEEKFSLARTKGACIPFCVNTFS